MTDQMRELSQEAQKQMRNVYIISMVLMAIVCIVACMCIAYQSTATAKAYFGYEAEPLSITNTQNNGGE